MEREFIRWLRDQVPSSPAVPVGVGDDAAVLKGAVDGAVVVTTDMLMDGVDFHLAQVNPARVGRKALAVNLSDLAAMAARPTAAFISLAIPRPNALQLTQQLYAGMFPLAKEFDVAIAGGDTNTWEGPLVISVTLVGAVSGKGALLRSGARPGDAIFVTGSLGGSLLGKHFDFIPRIREMELLHQRFELHAGMDISDGLSLDLSRMAEASGCGAELDLAAIPISPDARTLSATLSDGRTPLDHALSDGEDFELILAVKAGEAERLLQAQPLAIGLHRVGRFISEPGLWSRNPDGGRTPLAPSGFEHR